MTLPLTRPIRVGLVGYGYAGKTFHAPLLNASKSFELKAVASRRERDVLASFPHVAVETDPAALLLRDDIDLVVIATPNDTHAPLARAAMHAGKHVVIDKPFALDLEEARSLIVIAEERGSLLSVFHNRRWDSDFLTMRKALADNMIGTVRHFESHFDRFRPQVRDRWRETAGKGSGIWFDLGPHLVDQALQLFGLPDRVQVDLAAQRLGAVTDDWAHAILSYGETRVILHAGSLVAGGSHRFTAHGDSGSLIKTHGDRQEAQLVDGVRPGAPDWGLDEDPLIVIDANGVEARIPALRGEQRGYYAGVRNALVDGVPNPMPSIEALAVMAVIEAGMKSARSHTAVRLPLTDSEIGRWQDIERSDRSVSNID